ncbi:MAG: hypothetical protein F4Y01_13505 [Gammaproteobacteria bacterium]|nr:hypothetical protein [Gammaproteobacteria bacterium]
MRRLWEHIQFAAELAADIVRMLFRFLLGLVGVVAFLGVVIIVGMALVDWLPSFGREEWEGVVYPNRNNLLEFTRLAPNTTLEACRAAVRRYADAASWEWERLDYECGLNCRPYQPGSTLHICDKTLK